MRGQNESNAYKKPKEKWGERKVGNMMRKTKASVQTWSRKGCNTRHGEMIIKQNEEIKWKMLLAMKASMWRVCAMSIHQSGR
jgi:hypothetical protein